MENTNIPTDRELPSTAKLIKSTAIAAATAAVLLVTVVMPAEYGIDPTGIGNIIGLKKMGEIRVSLAKEEAQQQADAQLAQKEVVAQPDNSGIDAKPKQGETNAIAALAPTQLAAGILSHETQVTLARPARRAARRPRWSRASSRSAGRWCPGTASGRRGRHPVPA